MAENYIEVWQLNEYVRQGLEQDVFLSNIIVLGEISGLKVHSSGHIYFTLKDDKASIRCSFFRQYNYNLRFKLQDGMKVLAQGKVSLYVRDGQYQLYVYQIQQTGLGDLFVLYNQLKSKLENEGLFAAEHKKPIPPYIKKLGVVTSPTGAALQDIINVSTRRFPRIQIVVAPVKVQGEGAAESIARGIKYINTIPDVDTIIVGRGGGSAEDLWAFNEEVVARAIYESEKPIISAVGHETDFTIADFVADLRAPTPSAAAEIAVFDYQEICNTLAQYKNSSVSALNYAFNHAMQRLQSIKTSSIITNPKQLLNPYIQAVENVKMKYENLMENRLNAEKNKLSSLAANLESLSPLKVLARGYAVVTDNNNATISSVKQVKQDSELNIRVSDGTFLAVVK